jgi:hypothetical protein
VKIGPNSRKLSERCASGSVANRALRQKFDTIPSCIGGLVSKVLSLDELFKGRHFDAEIIVLGDRKKPGAGGRRSQPLAAT